MPRKSNAAKTLPPAELVLRDPLILLPSAAELPSDVTDVGLNYVREAEAFTEEMRKLMSPAGALRLPPLLDKRRLMIGIPDGAFAVQALWDRIFIWQIDHGDGQKFKGTSIYLTDQGKDRLQESAPRGIIVSAGLSALDSMRSNGLDVGHIVTFTRLAPYRIPCETIRGKEHYLCVINCGDLAGSEDLALALRQGLCKTVGVRKVTQGVETVEHVHQDKSKKTWVPELPWRSAEY